VMDGSLPSTAIDEITSHGTEQAQHTEVNPQSGAYRAQPQQVARVDELSPCLSQIQFSIFLINARICKLCISTKHG